MSQMTSKSMNLKIRLCKLTDLCGDFCKNLLEGRRGREGEEEVETSLIQVEFCSFQAVLAYTRANVHGIEMAGKGGSVLSSALVVLWLAEKVTSMGK